MKHIKIAVTKDETVKDVVGYVAAEDADAIIITIPKSSQLLATPDAFKKLKKVAEAMGKTIAVESVDDAILAFAKAAGIEASNPFFENHPPQKWGEGDRAYENTDDEEKKDDDEDDDDDDDDKTSPLVVATPVVNRIRSMSKPKIVRRYDDDGDDDDDITPPKRPWFKNKWTWVVALIIIGIPAYWIAFKVLPRAEIVIVTKKVPWNFNNLVLIEKNGPVPSQSIAQKKNAQMTFLATGKKVVSQKAGGKILVYNAYSSQPQQLVATTRFATESGAIIRLTKNITIPGAKIENNKITASSIEADVIADKPGPTYNVGPLKKLTIPGFKGTVKFAGFYGEIQKPLTGGFIGETAYPTDGDIKAAKAKITAVLKETLIAQIASQTTSGFMVAKGSEQVLLTKTEVNPQVNAQGEFSLFAEAELKAIAFKESDLLGYLTAKMKSELNAKEPGAYYVFKETKFAYDIPKVDFAALKMSLPVDFKGIAEEPISIDALRGKVMGKSEQELKIILFAISGIDSATVALWPGYSTRVPDNASSDRLKFIIK